jgi:hypothetical protein
MELEKMIEMVKSKGFSVSYSGYDGVILDNREYGMRCFIYRERSDNWVRISKYFDFDRYQQIRADIRGDIEIFNFDDDYFFKWTTRSFQKSFEMAKKDYLKNKTQ